MLFFWKFKKKCYLCVIIFNINLKTEKMFNLIVVTFITIIGVIGLLIPIQEINYIGVTILCISFVWLFASGINNLVCYTQQIERFENLRALLKNLELSKLREIDLTTKFKMYLATTYPDLEKEIFKDITDPKSEINIIMSYPEIKSSETLLELVNRIDNLSTIVFAQEKNIQSECAKVRFFNNNN